MGMNRIRNLVFGARRRRVARRLRTTCSDRRFTAPVTGLHVARSERPRRRSGFTPATDLTVEIRLRFRSDRHFPLGRPRLSPVDIRAFRTGWPAAIPTGVPCDGPTRGAASRGVMLESRERSMFVLQVSYRAGGLRPRSARRSAHTILSRRPSKASTVHARQALRFGNGRLTNDTINDSDRAQGVGTADSNVLASRERNGYFGRKAPATSAALALVIITAGTKVTGGTGWPER